MKPNRRVREDTQEAFAVMYNRVQALSDTNGKIYALDLLYDDMADAGIGQCNCGEPDDPHEPLDEPDCHRRKHIRELEDKLLPKSELLYRIPASATAEQVIAMLEDWAESESEESVRAWDLLSERARRARWAHEG
jgi:hypothetical protein